MGRRPPVRCRRAAGRADKMAESMDYYADLGVAPHAGDDEIRAAYRRAARRWHPDVCTRADAPERMRRINEAYTTLSDPGRRVDYNQKRGLPVSGWSTTTTSPTRTETAPGGRSAVASRAAAAAYDGAHHVGWTDATERQRPQTSARPAGMEQRSRPQRVARRAAPRSQEKERRPGTFAEAIQQVARIAPLQLVAVCIIALGTLAALYQAGSTRHGPELERGDPSLISAVAMRPSQQPSVPATVARGTAPRAAAPPVLRTAQQLWPAQVVPLSPLAAPLQPLAAAGSIPAPLAPAAPLPPLRP